MPRNVLTVNPGASGDIAKIDDNIAKILLYKQGFGPGRGSVDSPAENEYNYARADTERQKAALLQQQLGALGQTGLTSYITAQTGLPGDVVGQILAGTPPPGTDPSHINAVRGIHRAYGILPATMDENNERVVQSLGLGEQQVSLNAGIPPADVGARVGALLGKPSVAMESGILYNPYGEVNQTANVTPLAQALIGQRQASAGLSGAKTATEEALRDPRVAVQESIAGKNVAQTGKTMAETEYVAPKAEAYIGAQQAQAGAAGARQGKTEAETAQVTPLAEALIGQREASAGASEASAARNIAETEIKQEKAPLEMQKLQADTNYAEARAKAQAKGYKVPKLSLADTNAVLSQYARAKGIRPETLPDGTVRTPGQILLETTDSDTLSALIAAFSDKYAETGGNSAAAVAAILDIDLTPYTAPKAGISGVFVRDKAPVPEVKRKATAPIQAPASLLDKPSPAGQPVAPPKLPPVKAKPPTGKPAPTKNTPEDRAQAKGAIKEAMQSLIDDQSPENQAAFDAMFGPGKAAMVLKARGIQ
jgi:hypothetical protein